MVVDVSRTQQLQPAASQLMAFTSAAPVCWQHMMRHVQCMKTLAAQPSCAARGPLVFDACRVLVLFVPVLLHYAYALVYDVIRDPLVAW